MAHMISRRSLLAWGSTAAFSAALLAACGGGTATTASTGTAAAGAATSAAGTSAAATSAAASAATTAAAATSAPAGTQTVVLMKFAGVGWEQDDEAATEFQAANPTIKVNTQPVVYAEMFQKCLTLGAAGSLGDLIAGHNKWMPELEYRGIAYDLSAMVAQNSTKMNFDDFFPSVIADAKGVGSNGKLYVLPTVVHPGGNAVIQFNMDLMNKAGVAKPDIENWTTDDFNNIVRKTANPSQGIYGTQLIYSSTLYADQISRTWGSDPNKGSQDAWLLTADGKTQQLDSPAVKTSFEWYWQMIHDGLVPTSSVAPPNTPGGDFFTAGKLVSQSGIVGQPLADSKVINGKFEVFTALWPKGPHGYRGSCLSYNTYAIYGKTKVADAAFGLLDTLTSQKIGLFAAVKGEANPYARKSVWSDPSVWKVNPITQQAGQWLASGVDPFPQPYNLRFSEWLDAWTQNTSKYLDGKENWDQMFAHTQKACQDILDQARP